MSARLTDQSAGQQQTTGGDSGSVTSPATGPEGFRGEAPASLDTPAKLLGAGTAQDTRQACPPGERRPIFPPVRLGYWAWRDQVAHQLEQLAARQGTARVATRLRWRVLRYRRCATRVEVSTCDACDQHRPGTAIIPRDRKRPPCNARSCVFCQRRLADARARTLHSRIARMGAVAGLRWRFVTFTFRYDPSDEAHLSVAGLAARVQLARESGRALWHALRDHCHADALTWSIELAGHGNVHGHALVRSRWIDKAWLETQLGAAAELERQVEGLEAGHTWLRDCGELPDTSAIREVTKYVTKAPSPTRGVWMAGAPYDVMAPELAARWELATFGKRLHEHYGALRGALEDEGPAPELVEGDPDDAAVSCPACGVVGEWRREVVSTRAYCRAMYLRGFRDPFARPSDRPIFNT